MRVVRQNFSEYLRQLRLVFAVLLMTKVTMFIVFAVLAEPRSGEWVENVQLFVPLAMVVLLGTGRLLRNRFVGRARQEPGLRAKLGHYRSANVVHFALVELAVVAGLIGYYATAINTLLIFAGAALLIFAVLFPRRDRLVNELQLSAEEQALLDDPEADVAGYSLHEEG